MNKLTKISKISWAILISVIVLSIVLIILICTLKVDKTLNLNLYISDQKEVVVANYYAGANKNMKVGQKLILLVDNNYIETKIAKISSINGIAKFSLTNLPSDFALKPNEYFKAILFYDQNTLFNTIFVN